MPNTITKQTIMDGDLNLVVKVHLDSDGSEETGGTMIDASSYSPAFTNCRLNRLDIAIASSAIAFSGYLDWDADTDVPIIALPGRTCMTFDWSNIGGLPNNAGDGRTGDINLTTVGLENNDSLTLVFYLKKVL